MFRVVEKGEPNKKQRQALETMIRLVSAFADESGIQKEGRTWRELEDITGLSKGALAKHLKVLKEKGVVQYVPAHYEYTERPIEIEGKTLEGARRVYKRYTITLS